MLVYTAGQRRLYRRIRPLPLDVFLESYNQVYPVLNKISGTALYFALIPDGPPYIVHTMFRNHIIYETNVIVSIKTLDQPFG
jgi:KUP system potassium uptake protein